MNKYSYKKKRRAEEGTYKAAFFRMLPVLLMVGLVPLLTREYSYETNLTQYGWFDNETVREDFFLAFKSVALLLLFFVMAAIVLYRSWKERGKLPFAKILIPLFVYGGFVILSTIFSVNSGFSLSGSFEQFETVWALLSYVLAVYYVFLFASGESELLVVTDAFCVGVTLVSLTGTLQGMKIDPLATHFVQKLITSEEFLESIGGTLGIRFSSYACATLYNPNYVGSFAALAIPFLLVLLLFTKKWWRKVWYFAALFLTVMTMMFSYSSTGFIATAAALFVALIFCCRGLVKRWYLTIPALNLLVVLVLLLNAYSDGAMFDELRRSLAMEKQQVQEETAADGTVVKKTGLTAMETAADGVWVTYNEVTVEVCMVADGQAYGFFAFDENGEQIELLGDEDGMIFSFSHPALEDVTVSPARYGDELAMAIRVAGKNWNFALPQAEGERFMYITDMGKEDDMITAESMFFEGREYLASKRGFIWSRTLPLLKKHIVIGSGPDTFLLEFPQNDYAAMYMAGYANTVMTKPHCWYLQVGVQTGVISLIALLVFYGWYALQSISLYCFRKMKEPKEMFGLGAFLGSVGYMVAGIANDSMVVVAPMYWCVIGVGVAANLMVRKERAKAAESKQEVR